ncbi:hypothetical protein [Thalassospira sp. MCCC 1A03138]|uniref:hypothetical protein n=1 Tax=Thalassospira sp. MCCC 1A03138 TaxID=1470576 RepID=UPI000A1E17F9|nr:hypothetical protein [Thalassospira sp. MCCC 1A03138]OSQ32261.1 hypothetical protein TH468_01110 [Thalassospira sp. MCCC 1A03138]
MGVVFKATGGAGVGFAGDGERTVFPFQFAVFGSDDVAVRVDGKPVTTGFHVALNEAEEAPGGEVIFEVAPKVGAAISIRRHLRLRRLSAYGGSASPRGDAVDRDLDYLTAALGDVDRAMVGSLRLDPADQDKGDLALPRMEPGRALVWNDQGDGLANGPDAGEIAAAGRHGAMAQDAANRAEAAGTRAETALAGFQKQMAGAAFDLDLRAQNATLWQDERRMPVIDAPGDRIMDIRETGALVRLSNGGRLSLPGVSAARNGVRYRVVNGDGTMVDVAAASGDQIVPLDGAAVRSVHALPIRGDCVDLICDGTRWFAAPIAQNGPVVKLLRTNAQDIPAGGYFIVEWDHVAEDSHGLYDAALHGVGNLPPGFYHVDAGVNFAIGAEAVAVSAYVERLGAAGWSTHLQASDIVGSGSNATQSVRVSGIARIGIASDNALRLRVRHSDSITRQIAAGAVMSWFHLCRIGG